MRLMSKVSLSLCLVWGTFLCAIYFITESYFVTSLSRIAGWNDTEDIQIHHYAISQMIHHYQVTFVIFALLFSGLGWYVLRLILVRHLSNFTHQLTSIYHAGEYVRCVELDKKDEYCFAVKLANHMMDTIQKLQVQLAEEASKVKKLSVSIGALEQRAIKADQADAVLHTLCDHLQHMIISMSITQERVANLKTVQLVELTNLLAQQDNLQTFLTHDCRGQQVLSELTQLADEWDRESQLALKEIELLGKQFVEARKVVVSFSPA